MPAIYPERLKQQAQELARLYDTPDAFLRGVDALLEAYADRTRRAGQSGLPKPLLYAYHVPPPVLRQIVLALEPHIANNPVPALELAQQLWQQPNMECKQLAIEIVARLPAASSDQVLELIRAWSVPAEDIQVLGQLLDRGLSTVRRETPQKLLQALSAWFASHEVFDLQVGLRALKAYLQTSSYLDLPTVLKLLQPFVWQLPPGVRPDLIEVMRILVQSDPIEAAFFLRKSLESDKAVDTDWIIRQVLSLFPQEIAKDLRQALYTRQAQLR